MTNRTPQSQTNIAKTIVNVTGRYWRGHGGDLEEMMSEAFYHGARALQSYDPEKGELGKWLSFSVWTGLAETRRKELSRGKHRSTMPPVCADHPRWGEWCLTLAGELGDDAAALVRAALESPGEAIAAMAESGWSGPRLLAAIEEVKEALT